MKQNITLYCELCKLEINMPIDQFKNLDGGVDLDGFKCINCQSKLSKDLTPILEFKCGRCHEEFEDSDEWMSGFLRIDEFGWGGIHDRLEEFMLCPICSDDFKWWAGEYSVWDKEDQPLYVSLKDYIDSELYGKDN